jgi:hypothetical protein
MIISSQHHIDWDVVETKRAANDYVVTVATITDSESNEYQMVIDGHHSLAAAREDGVQPVIVESDYNYQAEVDCIGFDAFLAAKWIDSPYYDVETGIEVW